MDGTIIIAISIIMAVVISVYALIASSRKAAARTKEQMWNKLQQLAHLHQTKLGTHDYLGRKMVAMDEMKQKVFYIDVSNEMTEPIVVDIQRISISRVTKEGNKFTRTSKSGITETEEHVNRIYLEINMKDNSEEKLLFYSEAKDGILEMQPLRQLAEKWQSMIKTISV